MSLPGEMGKRDREEVNAVIDQCSSEQPTNYVILFKGVLGRNDYRALYKMGLDVGSEDEARIVKVHGAPGAPAQVTADMVMTLYKYNSGSKEFTTIGT